MSLVRIQRKGAVTLPIQLRNRLGLVEGDLVEVKMQGATTIVIKPQIVIDRSKFPADEYTADQRKTIQAEIDKARKGPYFGPFKNGEEVAAFLKTYRRRMRASSTKPKKMR